MRQKALTARRQKNQALARIDALNRCAWCRVNLLAVPTVVQYMGEPEVYCSDGCRTDRIAFAARWDR